MSQSPIELKGSNFTLSVLHLYSEEPKLIKKALQEKMKQAPGFLTNAPVVINVSALPLLRIWSPYKILFRLLD